jgi:hypothetical protein
MLRLVDLTKEFDAGGNAGGRVLATDRLNLEVNAGEVLAWSARTAPASPPRCE